jgi:uncharacterized protein (TIGR03435 family)
MSGPRVTLEGYNIALLIIEAYGLKNMSQLSFSGFPGHDDQLSVYYDIVARTPGDGARSRDDFRLMLQTLLADRFKMSLHREMKQMPVYALTLGKNGSKLKESAGDGECSGHVGVVPGGQSYSYSHCPIERLVGNLSNGLVDRPVVDKTGLTGKYDFRFEATPIFMSRRQPDLTELSPFTAIQDLGLKLQSQTAPMEIIAVDSFERPTAN